MKKLFRALLASLLVVLLLTGFMPANNVSAASSGCPTSYRLTYFSPTKTGLSFGMAGESVKGVQILLNKLNYPVGLIDGILGVKTKVCISLFQRDVKLPVTGVADQFTIDKMQAIVDKLYGKTAPLPQPVLQPEPVDEPEPMPATQPVPQTPPTQPSAVELTVEEQMMIDLVNQERQAAGLQKLTVDYTLVKTARLKSKDMIEHDYFSHTSPVYGSPFDLMKSQGVSYRYAGENLAGAPSVERAHTGLMNSSGHRANILNPNFTHIGVGIIDGGRYGKMFTQHFVGR